MFGNQGVWYRHEVGLPMTGPAIWPAHAVRGYAVRGIARITTRFKGSNCDVTLAPPRYVSVVTLPAGSYVNPVGPDPTRFVSTRPARSYVRSSTVGPLSSMGRPSRSYRV